MTANVPPILPLRPSPQVGLLSLWAYALGRVHLAAAALSLFALSYAHAFAFFDAAVAAALIAAVKVRPPVVGLWGADDVMVKLTDFV